MLREKLEQIDLEKWEAPELKEDIPHGDMPGDKIKIGDDHLMKASKIFPVLVEKMKDLNKEKIVISVFGGSGVGKSEIASLLAYYLRESGVNTYVMSGDNYPYRIPLYNDAERLSVFRANGMKGLIEAGVYDREMQETLNELWEKESDPDPKMKEVYPWLSYYQETGRKALAEYLGTFKEQDYDQVNEILREFKDNKAKIYLKRMGRSEDARWYDLIDFSDIPVLIMEWTHGGNKNIYGIDIPILLNSTPEETREHRRLRARDGKTDSAFTTMVLEIEQMELDDRASSAAIILSKAGEFLDPASF